MFETLIPKLLFIAPYIAIPPITAAAMYLVARIMMLPREDMSYVEILGITAITSILAGVLESVHFAAMAGLFFIMIWAGVRLQLNIRWRESLILALSGFTISYLVYLGVGMVNPFEKKDVDPTPVQAEVIEELPEVMHAADETLESPTEISPDDLEVLEATEDDSTEDDSSEDNSTEPERKLPKLPKNIGNTGN